ncbi:bestrophin family protein [bacterium]|nr:bestrophin family protein [bacterium]
MVQYDPRNWVGVLTQTHGSVLPRLAPRVLLIALLGAAASYLFEIYKFKLPPMAHTMVGAALGLLLVFRTNTSYDRYWEGRKLLGGGANRLRDLMRQVAGGVSGEEGHQLCQELRRQIILFFGLQRQYLRNERDLSEFKEMTEAEKALLEPLNARPVAYLAIMSQLINDAHLKGLLNDALYRNIDLSLGQLMDNLGGAERILKTPVPFAYAQHIKGFLFIFCFTLPFVLAEPTGRWNVLASAGVAYALFGIEEIGVEIEDPFGDDPNDLPLEAMEEGLKKVTSDLLAMQRH